MTLNPMCDNVETKQGVPLTVTGVAQVKIMKDDKFLGIAAEQFLGKKGIEILSFTIKDVYDNVDYLSSLGKSQTAAVKRDAEIGVAQANRDAGIREAECEKAAMDIK